MRPGGDSLGSLEVDGEYELCWLFDRQLAWLRTFEDLVGKSLRI